MSVAPNPGTTRSGIGVTIWTWSATSRYGWSGFIRDARNRRSFAAATFKATIKRKRCSKQNAELTLYFWFRRQFLPDAGWDAHAPSHCVGLWHKGTDSDGDVAAGSLRRDDLLGESAFGTKWTCKPHVLAGASNSASPASTSPPW